MAEVRTDPDFAVESRAMLLDWAPYRPGQVTPDFDLSPDDERLLAIRINSVGGATDDILVQNFFEELRQVVPD